MTAMSEIIRSEGKRDGDAQKASVVRAGAKYRSEQGSDYEPGVSAETVGSKVLFLGIVTLPAGARTRAHTCTSGMRLPSTCSAAKSRYGPETSYSTARWYGPATTFTFRQTFYMLLSTVEKNPRSVSAHATNPLPRKASCSIPRWTPGYRKQCRGIVKDAR